MNRIICVLLMCIAMISSAVGQDGTAEYSSEFFELSGRKVVVKGATGELKSQLTDALAHNGAVVVDGFFNKLFSPGVKLTQHKNLNGYESAYSIEVTYSKVRIDYTSGEMRRLAIRDFYKLLDSQGEMHFIRGCKLFFYNLESSDKNAIAMNDKGILDGVSTLKPLKRLLPAVEQMASRGTHQAIVALSNGAICRVRFNSFKGINANKESFANTQTYSTEDIVALVNAAKNRGGEFIPAINLLSESPLFEDYTGHTMTSVEGMRFVRVMIEDCVRDWGVKTICIGTVQDDNVPAYYTDFLDNVARIYGIELLIL